MKLTLERAQKMMAANDGCLELSYTNITELPEGLVVPGYLNLRCCNKLAKLPDNLTVGGELDLAATDVTELPAGLRANSLNLSATPISTLPEGLTIEGNLNLNDCCYLTKLPQNLKVGHCLAIRSTGITELPDDLVAGKIVSGPEIVPRYYPA